MGFTHNNELQNRLEEAYTKGDYSKVLEILSTLDALHPYISLYCTKMYVRSTKSFEDVENVIECGKLASENAWIKYGPSPEFADFYALLAGVSGDCTKMQSDLYGIINAIVTDSTDRVDNLLDELKRRGQPLSNQASNDVKNYLDINRSQTLDEVDAIEALIQSLQSADCAIIKHYFEVCEREQYYSTELNDYVLYNLSRMIEQLQRLLEKYADDLQKYDPIIAPIKDKVDILHSAHLTLKSIRQHIEVDKYWAEHADEKEKLMDRITELKQKMKSNDSKLNPLRVQINELQNLKNEFTPAEINLETLKQSIAKKRNELNSLVFFKGKEKRALQQDITSLESELISENTKALAERQDKDNEYVKKINPLLNKVSRLERQQKKFENELETLEHQLLYGVD